MYWIETALLDKCVERLLASYTHMIQPEKHGYILDILSISLKVDLMNHQIFGQFAQFVMKVRQILLSKDLQI